MLSWGEGNRSGLARSESVSRTNSHTPPPGEWRATLGLLRSISRSGGGGRVLERNHLHHSGGVGLTFAQSGAEYSCVRGLRTQTWSSARTLGNSPLWCGHHLSMTWNTFLFLEESTRLRTETWEECSGVGWPGTRKPPPVL